MQKQIRVLLAILFAGLFITVTCLVKQKYQQEIPMDDAREWLAEQGLPSEFVNCLTDSLSADLKTCMENRDYEIGDLVDRSTPEQTELMLSIRYKDDLDCIVNYDIRKSKVSSAVQGEASVKCLWDKDELTLKSFACICCIEDYEIFNSNRAMHAGLGYYEVQFPTGASELTGPVCTIIVSKFVPANEFVCEFDSIQYIYKEVP